MQVRVQHTLHFPVLRRRLVWFWFPTEIELGYLLWRGESLNQSLSSCGEHMVHSIDEELRSFAFERTLQSTSAVAIEEILKQRLKISENAGNLFPEESEQRKLVVHLHLQEISFA
jgi:hypothetical protein